ncbi:MAG: glutaminyl-peptide cyclotransferase [Polyangiales bacterium]
MTDPRPVRSWGFWMLLLGIPLAIFVAMRFVNSTDAPAANHASTVVNAQADSTKTETEPLVRQTEPKPEPTEFSTADTTLPPKELRVKVLKKHPHESNAFTQGLLWHDGKFYESTGTYGGSSLRSVDVETGKVERHTQLPSWIFAEGLAIHSERLTQLTWKSGKAYVWRLNDFAKIKEFDYPGEGWGLCALGDRFVMSDGSDSLRILNPDTFEIERRVTVHAGDQRLRNLNELECVDGFVYANVWQTNSILRIDPSNGRVDAIVDASRLLTADEASRADVLNGIAYRPTDGHYFLTGKFWPWVFEVQFVPAND